MNPLPLMLSSFLLNAGGLDLLLSSPMMTSSQIHGRPPAAQEAGHITSVLVPVVPTEWSLAHIVRPGGPEGRNGIVSEVSLNHQGELNKFTYRARNPDAKSKSVSHLSKEDREEYLRLFAAALESFSFEPATEGWFDSETLTLSLKSGQQSMDVVIQEMQGETNLEFRTRLAKFIPVDSRIDRFKKYAQPDPAKRFGRMADAWGLYVSLEVGTKRRHRVEIQSGALRTLISDPTFPADRRRSDAIMSPGQLRVREWTPQSIIAIVRHTADVEERVAKEFLENALTMCRHFSFEEGNASEGQIAVSVTLRSRCLSVGETSRELTIKHSGLTPAQFEKSDFAKLIHIVNARIPIQNQIRWD